MLGHRPNFALRLDLVLVITGAICFELLRRAGYHISEVPFLVILVALMAIVHLVVQFKILVPLKRFAEMADNIADGELENDLAIIKSSELDDLQTSFTKITANLVEYRSEIENYMLEISEKNKLLSKKVDSLSLIFSAGKAMGTTLNVDSLVRTLLNLLIEKLDVSGAAVMLYYDKTDQVTIKDLIGFSPDLFAKFRFFSDHRLVVNLFAGESFMDITDSEQEMIVAEFDCDAAHAFRLFYPMRIKDHFVGITLLGQKKDQTPFSESDKDLIATIIGLGTMSINNAALFERSEATKNELDRKVFNLMTLQQSGKVLSSTLNLEELLSISIDMFLETVWSNKGVLYLHGEDNFQLEVKAMKGITNDEVIELEKDPGESWAMTTLLKEKRPILAQEARGKFFMQNPSTIDQKLAFAVYLPLIKEGEIYGVVKIGAKINGEPFSENDLEFFSTLSSQAVIAFENARLYSLAITDSITKLYIHRYFQLRLEEEVRRSQRYNSTVALLMIDIDHFKDFNDTYGHQQGDVMLKEVSQILKRNIRSTDIAARYGGEEFVIILPETTQGDAKVVAERIRRDVANHPFPSIAAPQDPLHCTVSVGVAGYPLNANDKDELIQKADSSMYLAKGSGRNKVVLCGVDG